MRWHALHDYNDRFLLEAVAPAARAAVANGAASGWFFIRYWEGGPHLRLRLADAPPETVDSVAGQLTGWLLAHPVESLTAESYYGEGWAAAVEKMGWHEHGISSPAMLMGRGVFLHDVVGLVLAVTFVPYLLSHVPREGNTRNAWWL